MEVELAQSGQLANLAAQRVSGNDGLEQEKNQQVENQKRDSSDSSNVTQLNADNKVDARPAETTEIESAVEEVSDFVQASTRNLNFSFNEESNRNVVKVTDSQTGELIRQIPSEEVLRLSERIRDLQTDVGATVGVLFSKEV